MINIFKKYKGDIYVLLAMFFMLATSILVKIATNIETIDKVFARNILMLIVTFIIIKKNNISLKTKNYKLIILRSLCGVGIVCSSFYTIAKLQIKDAYAIDQFSPFIVIFMASIILNEKVKKKYFLSIIISIIGLLFIVRPMFESDLLYIGIRIFKLFLGACVGIMLRTLRKTEKTEVMMFYYALISLIVLSPFVIVNFQMPNLRTLLFLLIIAIASYFFQYFNTKSLKHIEVSKASVYRNMQIIFSAIAGVLIFGETLIWMDYVGIGLVLFAGYINFKY